MDQTSWVGSIKPLTVPGSFRSGAWPWIDSIQALWSKSIKQENPDLVLCTHFLPAEILIYLRKKKILDIPIGVVVTDIDAHAMWLLQNVDWYFVACEETRVYLAALGIPSETIFVTGIPIDPIFGVEKPKRETRLRLGLDPDKTTILVSVGGFGVGPVESLVHTIHEIQHPVQMSSSVVVTPVWRAV